MGTSDRDKTKVVATCEQDGAGAFRTPALSNTLFSPHVMPSRSSARTLYARRPHHALIVRGAAGGAFARTLPPTGMDHSLTVLPQQPDGSTDRSAFLVARHPSRSQRERAQIVLSASSWLANLQCVGIEAAAGIQLLLGVDRSLLERDRAGSLKRFLTHNGIATTSTACPRTQLRQDEAAFSLGIE